MLNKLEQIEKANFKWVHGLYIKITGSIETLTSDQGADRLIMSNGIYDAMAEKYAGEMYVEATDENFRDYMLKNGGISQIRFIHFICNNKWYAITDQEAIEHKIKEDVFNYDAFDFGRSYDKSDIKSQDALMNAYNFNEHKLLEKGRPLTRHNIRINKLLDA